MNRKEISKMIDAVISRFDADIETMEKSIENDYREGMFDNMFEHSLQEWYVTSIFREIAKKRLTIHRNAGRKEVENIQDIASVLYRTENFTSRLRSMYMDNLPKEIMAAFDAMSRTCQKRIPVAHEIFDANMEHVIRGLDDTWKMYHDSYMKLPLDTDDENKSSIRKKTCNIVWYSAICRVLRDNVSDDSFYDRYAGFTDGFLDYGDDLIDEIYSWRSNDYDTMEKQFRYFVHDPSLLMDIMEYESNSIYIS